MDLKEIRRDDQELVYGVTGNISGLELTDDTDPLHEILDGGEPGLVVRIDLGESDFIDSSGIGWLIRCNRRLKEKGGKLVIHAPTPNVARSFEFMKLGKVLNIEPNSVTV